MDAVWTLEGARGGESRSLKREMRSKVQRMSVYTIR